MQSEKLRRQIVFEAAKLMFTRQETDAYRARLTAARSLRHGYIPPSELPSTREVHDQIQRFASGESRDHNPLGTGGQNADPVSDDERFTVYRSLLLPLECVRQNRRSHPEGDALYHSLQVFELVRDQRPYDEELLLAALLHDVGKAIDPLDHVTAGLSALAQTISDRTAWFIAHHNEARALRDGSLGVRARRRLSASPDFEDLELLTRCDRDGRVPGARVSDVDDALSNIRNLAASYG